MRINKKTYNTQQDTQKTEKNVVQNKENPFIGMNKKAINPFLANNKNTQENTKITQAKFSDNNAVAQFGKYKQKEFIGDKSSGIHIHIFSNNAHLQLGSNTYSIATNKGRYHSEDLESALNALKTSPLKDKHPKDYELCLEWLNEQLGIKGGESDDIKDDVSDSDEEKYDFKNMSEMWKHINRQKFGKN